MVVIQLVLHVLDIFVRILVPSQLWSLWGFSNNLKIQISNMWVDMEFLFRSRAIASSSYISLLQGRGTFEGLWLLLPPFTTEWRSMVSSMVGETWWSWNFSSWCLLPNICWLWNYNLFSREVASCNALFFRLIWCRPSLILNSLSTMANKLCRYTML